ncbi:hypothetical protein CQA49_03415 [Helicobacter sp. MIT 00-7814]|uniref:hypothetical protein n=1 Tax=unclassified Helicobacter TaxID=2593540 RepID=UPI000E1F7711|nr:MULTISPECIES: hypothetical protein [unclassified Helicobacter]RDU55521.1 hypothetical protein CQA37_03835 [Helicobacter sp. MIT 99-10781]RDU55611.1 hypothetical protein CQA49_03415 [Helicobacter sp. MIT 00-7814]
MCAELDQRRYQNKKEQILKQPNSVKESTESKQYKKALYVRAVGNKAEFISAQLKAERSS